MVHRAVRECSSWSACGVKDHDHDHGPGSSIPDDDEPGTGVSVPDHEQLRGRGAGLGVAFSSMAAAASPWARPARVNPGRFGGLPMRSVSALPLDVCALRAGDRLVRTSLALLI
jgi:hypothetical protein